MAQNLKAKTNSLLSILNATTQNETKVNVEITNHIPDMIAYLIEVSEDESLKAPQRMAAIKLMIEMKDKIDKKLFAKVEELQAEAEAKQQATQAIKRAKNNAEGYAKTPEEIREAKLVALKMLDSIPVPSQEVA